MLLADALRPVVLEVRAPLSPSVEGWALLRAPFELLADDAGFLAGDGLSRFAVVRRLGGVVEPLALDEFRLGLAFMASAPRGQHELDFEAEESAILTAVGDVDLWVDESGDPLQLADRLKRMDPGFPVVHVSCHGLNSWVERDGADPQPVLAMENETGDLRLTTAPMSCRTAW